MDLGILMKATPFSKEGKGFEKSYAQYVCLFHTE